MPPKVIVRDLHKHYGSVQGARGVSFEIQDGEIKNPNIMSFKHRDATYPHAVRAADADAGR